MDFIPKGTLVTIVKLTGSSPAKLLKTIPNVTLKNDLDCEEANANQLIHINDDSPAKEYIEKGYIVRSAKQRGHWYQVCYLESDLPNTGLTSIDYKANRNCYECGEVFYGPFCHSCGGWS